MWSSTGNENLARVAVNSNGVELNFMTDVSWVTSRQIYMYYNQTSKQLFFNKHEQLKTELILEKLKLESVWKILTMERWTYFFWWPYKLGKILKDFTSWDFRK